MKTRVEPECKLFPEDLRETEWTTFEAKGFSRPVAGVIYRTERPACCGVPLGGLGTGCLDIETTGVLGFSTILDQTSRRSLPLVGPMTPKGCVNRHPQILLPFLGLSIREWAKPGDARNRTWVLAARQFVDGGPVQGCTEPRFIQHGEEHNHPAKIQDWYDAWAVDVPRIDDVEAAKEIDYWGHYPVADIQFDTTAPVKVSLRAWSPFIPGDLAASNVPGTVFEVRVSNSTDTVQCATLGFSFPGPEDSESKEYRRSIIKEDGFSGVAVNSIEENVGYAVGVLTQQHVEQWIWGQLPAEGTKLSSSARFGTGLHHEPSAWSKIASGLPDQRTVDSDEIEEFGAGSASTAVDFILQPGETATVRFVLAWYAPEWVSDGWETLLCFEPVWKDQMPDYEIPGRDVPPDEGEHYTAMYATRFQNAEDVALHLARNHVSLLKRILAWQEAIYASEELPSWLRDTLINHMGLLTEDSFWAQPKKPLGDWSFPEGAFGTMECPRFCPITGCGGSNWYGDLPLLYFFPQLEKAICRDYKEYIRPDGCVPFLFPFGDFTKPTYEWIAPINGVYYADMVDRLWARTKDDGVLREFYPSIKKSTIFTMTMTPGPDGILMARPTPDGKPRTGQLPWEHTPATGMVPFIASMRLFNLQIAKRMAEATGDQEFADQCQEWFDHTKAVMDEKLWAGDSYLFYYDPVTGEKNDDILSAQLDADWASMSRGLSGVFQGDRAKTTLDTIKRSCETDYGFVGFASRMEGPKLHGYGTFYPENVIVGMTYIYHGETEYGLEIIRRFVHNVVCKQRHPWDTPNLITCDTGERLYGTDYNQNMLLWAIPAALAGQELTAPCASGGLVDRVLQASADIQVM